MTLEIILNELSLKNPATDINTARDWISNFILTLKAIKKSSKLITLRTQYDFHSAQLALNYPIRRWLNDREVDREERRFLRNLATKSPFSEDIIDVEIKEVEENTAISEFYYEGELAIGLGIAYLLDALSISILSESQWNFSRLNLDVITIDENEELIDEQIELCHISCRDHVQEHTDWIQNRIKIQIYDGVKLWKLKEELFPRLEFCDSVGKQLQNIKRGQLELKLVREALSQLDSCCQNWTSGSFSTEGYSLEISPESTVTLNQYSQERTFSCPDGQERLFEQHIKLRVCNWRIHFYPKEEPGKIIIGYIGRHLPTVKYRT